MTSRPANVSERKPSPFLSVAIFAFAVGGMAWLRLYVFRDRFITLTYGLPLLVCLWHRDRRLLWTMAAAFVGMSYFKAFHVLRDSTSSGDFDWLQWFFQVVNIVIIAGAVHGILYYTRALRVRNIALAAANEELKAQGEELAQQNEEIQRQSEELSQQNEELNRQSEELQQQNEELERQGEELHANSEDLKAANEDLADREMMLAALLKAAAVNDRSKPVLQQLCEMALALMGRAASCVVVAEKQEGEIVVQAHSGLAELERDRWPYQNSLAAVVMQHQRTAAVHDLKQRPDLIVPRSRDLEMRASLATPLRLAGEIIAVLEVHCAEPRAWTTREFQLLEWAAAQCALMLELTRLRDDLSRRNSDLQTLVDERTAKLQELVNELEHFSYTITHDMRAPLRALQGFAGLLVEECADTLTAAQADYLQRIVQSAERMDRLVTDALCYSHAVRLQQPLAPVDLDRLLRGIIASYPAFQLPRANVEIHGPLPPVLANEAGLTQCLSNLIANAVKFVPESRQPHVLIRAETPDGVVRLWVEDNGIGIPEDFQPRLFGMFQRYSKQYEGTGIGLALVRKVCERMGGRVGVNSRVGFGSQFWIELQAASTPNPAASARAKS